MKMLNWLVNELLQPIQEYTVRYEKYDHYHKKGIELPTDFSTEAICQSAITFTPFFESIAGWDIELSAEKYQAANDFQEKVIAILDQQEKQDDLTVIETILMQIKMTKESIYQSRSKVSKDPSTLDALLDVIQEALELAKANIVHLQHANTFNEPLSEQKGNIRQKDNGLSQAQKLENELYLLLLKQYFLIYTELRINKEKDLPNSDLFETVVTEKLVQNYPFYLNIIKKACLTNRDEQKILEDCKVNIDAMLGHLGQPNPKNKGIEVMRDELNVIASQVTASCDKILQHI